MPRRALTSRRTYRQEVTDAQLFYSLVAPTFNRSERLPTFLDTYASGKIPSLRRVILLWNEIETSPPSSLVESLPSYPVSVVIEQRHINSLNQRFHKSDNMKTDCILAMDDDILFKPADIELGYQAWKNYGLGRKSMVGYIPRQASKDGVYVWRHLKSYSMVLTKSAFFHIDWMGAYWSSEPTMTGLRDYIDERKW